MCFKPCRSCNIGQEAEQCASARCQEAKAAELAQWGQRLTALVYQTVGQIRIEDLFDIVKLYPDSLPAVRDLEQCLQQGSLQRALVRVYCQSCASRLQIPGDGGLTSPFLLEPRSWEVFVAYSLDQKGYFYWLLEWQGFDLCFVAIAMP